MASDERAAVLIVDRSTYRFLGQDFAVPGSGEHVWTLAEMKQLLAAQGLDVCTKAERRVLEAFAAYVTRWEAGIGEDEVAVNLRCDAIEAELAARKEES